MSFLLFQIPVFLFGNMDQTAGPVTEDKKVNLRISNPADIECYYPAYHEPGCMIVMRSGKEFITDLTAEQIDNHIAGFYQAVAKMAQQEAAKPGILIATGQA